MKTIEDRLGELFCNEEFLQKNADKETVDEIYEAVVAEMPDVSKEEVENFLINVSKTMDVGEISEEELDNVAGGGLTWLGVCAGIYATGQALSFLYKAGKKIGKAIYYMTH